MRTFFLASTLVFTASAGCSEYGLQPDTMLGPNARPDIEVSPDEVAFGSVSMTDIGSWPTQAVQIRNVGEGILEVERVRVEDGPFSFVEDPGRFEIRPGDSREVLVRFDIQEPGRAEGSLTVASNDPDENVLTVPISGRARGPWLMVDPPIHDFGTVPLACPKELEVVVQNVGDEPLTVNEIVYEGDAGLSIALERVAPFELVAGEFTIGTVTLNALEEGAVLGQLVVDSTDPRGRQVAVQEASPEGSKTRSDLFDIPPDPPVDLVIAVDRSASMEDDAELLGESFVHFATTLGEVTSNWRIGVVTLDSGCFNEGVLTRSTPSYLEAFQRAVTTGTDLAIQDDEALFSLVDRALDNDEPGGCNAGFRREGAALHVIVVSDEPERSTERSAALTWDAFIDRWATQVDSPSLLKVSGVVDLEGCGDGADGYVQAIEATKGEALSLCTAAWSETATTLARATLDRVLSLHLQRRPVPGTLVIRIDGELLEGGYTYDAAANRVVIPAPGNGAREVKVHYTVADTCN